MQSKRMINKKKEKCNLEKIRLDIEFLSKSCYMTINYQECNYVSAILSHINLSSITSSAKSCMIFGNVELQSV